MGYRALDFSANVIEHAFREQEEAEKAKADGDPGSPADDEEADPAPSAPEPEPAGHRKPPPERAIGRWAMGGVFVASMALAMLLFVALPNAATHGLGRLAALSADAADTANSERLDHPPWITAASWKSPQKKSR